MKRASRALVPPPNPSGLCLCGCGRTVQRASTSKPALGIAAGEYVRFIPGHQNHLRRRENSWHWKGGRAVAENGYVRVYLPEHPAAQANGYVGEHHLVAEQELGRPLRPDEAIHHLNKVPYDNDPKNIIVLASHKDHAKLHAWLRRSATGQ
jgi:hypothetical protein